MKYKFEEDIEYIILLSRIQMLKDELEEARRERWNYYRKHKAREIYQHKGRQPALSMWLFGKRKKDLTQEELKEYNRVMARRSRSHAELKKLLE